MFIKRERNDEMDYGAQLYIKHLKESKQANTAQGNIAETPSVYKESKIAESFVSTKVELGKSSIDILERARELAI